MASDPSDRRLRQKVLDSNSVVDNLSNSRLMLRPLRLIFRDTPVGDATDSDHSLAKRDSIL